MAKKVHAGPHMYHRVNLSVQRVWACALPDCYHYIPKHMESMAEGKSTLCTMCKGETRLTSVNMGMDEPVCVDCMEALQDETVDYRRSA